jgi:hypothetical protein
MLPTSQLVTIGSRKDDEWLELAGVRKAYIRFIEASQIRTINSSEW